MIKTISVHVYDKNEQMIGYDVCKYDLEIQFNLKVLSLLTKIQQLIAMGVKLMH